MFRIASAGVPARARCLLIVGPLLLLPVLARAHGVAGARIFPATLTIDDPAVSDELALPTVTYQRQGVDANGNGPFNTYEIDTSFAKRITDKFGVSISLGHSFFDAMHGKSANGWQNITIGAKYQAYVSAEHEVLVSVGVDRDMPRTGTVAIGADSVGTTTPTVYFGKGFGDLPIQALRPFALTGTFGYALSDKRPRGSDTFNGGHEDRYVGGLSLQYSIPYLEQQVRHHNLPDWVAALTPLVEISYSSPANRPSTAPAQMTIAPGVVYSADTYQFAVEALIPTNRNAGTNVGVIAEFHMFLDDLLPHSLGRPVVDWFQ